VNASGLPEGRCDVLVAGGGLAGLATAWNLRSSGFRVGVLEAKDRVGGRLLLQTASGGVTVDGGGSWVGPLHTEVIRLVDQFGLHLVPQYSDGQNLLRLNGRTMRYRGDIPRLNPVALIDIGRAMRALDRMGRRLGPPPWRQSVTARLDSQTAGSWMDRHVRTAAGRLVLTVAVAASFCCRPDELSLMAFLAHVGGAGGLSSLIAVTDGALAYRIAEGAASLPGRLAEALAPSVRLKSPVARIERGGDHVTVHTASGAAYRARRMVLALDPRTAARISHEPPLPVSRLQLQEHYQLGSGIKAHVSYDRPWWREAGFSGSAVSDTGTTRLTFDVSPPARDRDQTPGVLLALMGLAAIDDPEIMAPHAAGERRERVLADLASFFGPQARNPAGYIEQDWSQEPWQSGCLPRLQPGVLSRYHDWLTKPVGPLHWAGTETSYEWEGHMEGAVRSGIRAAAEVAAGLSKPRDDTGPADAS
jgi:monoamine oxidase